MRVLFLMPLSVLCLIGLSVCGGARDSVAVVQFVTGPVNIERVGVDAPIPARIGETILETDTIVTGEGGAIELDVRGVGVVRIGENSRLELTEFTEGRRIEIRVEQGRAGLFVGEQEPEGELVVTLPTLVASVRGTRFLAGADDEVGSKLALFDGALAVADPGGRELVMDGQSEIRLEEGAALTEDALGPLSAESIAEMRALEEMTSLDPGRQPRISDMPPPAAAPGAGLEQPRP